MHSIIQRAVDRAGLFLLAALLWCCCLPAMAIRPDSQENRVGGCGLLSSGQTVTAASQTLANATSCGGWGYKTASGQWRWLNRDSIQERGGINLYSFVHNSPINGIDSSGLLDVGNDDWLWMQKTSPSGTETPSEFKNDLEGLLSVPMNFADWAADESGLTGLLGMAPSDMGNALAGSLPELAPDLSPELEPELGPTSPKPSTSCPTAAPKPKPGGITGFTKHGINRAIGDNAKRAGVSPTDILDAMNNPLKTRSMANGTIQYIGQNATVVVNQTGQVVSVWPQ